MEKHHLHGHIKGVNRSADKKSYMKLKKTSYRKSSSLTAQMCHGSGLRKAHFSTEQTFTHHVR